MISEEKSICSSDYLIYDSGLFLHLSVYLPMSLEANSYKARPCNSVLDKQESSRLSIPKLSSLNPKIQGY